MTKTKLLNIRIDPVLQKKAKRLAEADGRSLSNWVTNLISSQVKAAEKLEKQSEEGQQDYSRVSQSPENAAGVPVSQGIQRPLQHGN